MSESCLFISNLNPSDCASWVQAIGSILAILVAVGVARHSATQAREAYVQARVERLSEAIGPVMALIDAAGQERVFIWNAVVHANHGGDWGVSPSLLSNLESIAKALDEIPVHTMPSGRAATSLIDSRVWLQALLGASRDLVSKAQMMVQITEEQGKTSVGIGEELARERDALRQELVRLTLPIEGATSGFRSLLGWISKR